MNSIGNEGAIYFADLLLVNQVRLRISSTIIRDAIHFFVQTLHTLDLPHNLMDAQGAKPLVGALKMNQVRTTVRQLITPLSALLCSDNYHS